MFDLRAHFARPRKAILSDKSIEMMQNSTVSTGGRSRYGLGWWVDEQQHGYRSLLGQGGTDDGMAFLQLIPSEEIVVVVLTNTGDEFPSKIVDEILSVLLPSYRLKRATAANSPSQQPSPPVEPPTSLVGNWVGSVAHIAEICR